jgi:uncharacterized protein involved in type VI secretion and phage assembly
MSISVKNISLSVNGTPSNQFKIELDGGKYRIDELRLIQKLLEPCKLKFKLRKDPEEDISEIQFTACGSMIGKSCTLSLQTDSVEQEISGFAAGSQNADIEFEGIIVSARARRCETEFAIIVEAETKDTALKDHPDCKIYNEDTLANIVNEELNGAEAEVQPKMEDQIFYTTKYNETTYEFLQRLARRHGEWMFNTGKKLHFGKLSDQESISLAYPSQDLPEYSARLQTFHPNFRYYALGLNEYMVGFAYKGEEQDDTGNKLNDATFAASKEVYKAETKYMMRGATLEADEKVEASMSDPDYIEDARAERQGIRANMLVYHGKTFCSKMKIGAKLTIKDNYTSSGSLSDKSEVQQDEILITEVIHKVSIDDEYSNEFQGITANIDYPPYHDPNIFPRCDHPLRARVSDTNDPKHWGRVKVYFPWMKEKYKEDHKNGQTPWIHVAQPYVYTVEQQNKFGCHLIPELFSTVFVNFEEGNFERPYVSGAQFGQKEPVEEGWYEPDNKVKAIRTASGHTIEIHDVIEGKNYQDGGFIRVYDNQTQIYEVLLSTDKSLIKLNCKGDIVMHADGNIDISAGGNIKETAGGSISNKAGKHVSNSAGGDFNAGAGGTFNGSAGGEVLINAGSNFSAKASAKLDMASSDEMTIHSGANMTIDTSKEMVITSELNMTQSTNKQFSLTVQEDANATVNKNLSITAMNNAELNATNGITIKGMSITEQAQTDFKQYALNYTINAQTAISLQATASIDLKALMINEN